MDTSLRDLQRRDARGDPDARDPLRRALVRSGQADPLAALASALHARTQRADLCAVEAGCLDPVTSSLQILFRPSKEQAHGGRGPWPGIVNTLGATVEAPGEPGTFLLPALLACSDCAARFRAFVFPRPRAHPTFGFVVELGITHVAADTYPRLRRANEAAARALRRNEVTIPEAIWPFLAPTHPLRRSHPPTDHPSRR